MPKYGIHGIVLSRAIDDLPAGTLRDDLAANKGIAMMGAMGPDIFFWAPDYEVVRPLRRLYENLMRVVEAYDAIMKPIREIEELVDKATEDVIGLLAPDALERIRNLAGFIDNTSRVLDATVGTGLFAGVLGITDLAAQAASLPNATSQLFRQFVPPLQTRMAAGSMPDVNAWYWFDVLHYRRTGRFARALATLADARGKTERAYARGYLSHIATDVVGHAFVNRVVGAPYRLAVQRHATVENFLDAWAYGRAFNGESVSRTLLSRLALPDRMPPEIAALLDGAMRDVYGDFHLTHLGGSGFLSPDQITETYDSFYQVLHESERSHIERPPEPFPGAIDFLNGMLNEFLGPPPSLPSPPAGTAACGWEEILAFGLTQRSRVCYDGFFRNPADGMKYCGEYLRWTSETVSDLAVLIRETFGDMPPKVFLTLLYAVQLLLYGYYRTARYVVALHGFIAPEPDELANAIGMSLTTAASGCGDAPYPRLGGSGESHLVCPVPGGESPGTVPDANPASPAATADLFIAGAPFRPDDLAFYSMAATPAATRALAAGGRRIGNAAALSGWMIRTATDPGATDRDRGILYTDWNLDSDRGYGYKTWEGRWIQGVPAVDPENYVA